MKTQVLELLQRQIKVFENRLTVCDVMSAPYYQAQIDLLRFLIREVEGLE